MQKSPKKTLRKKYVSMVYFQQLFLNMMQCPICQHPHEHFLPRLHFFSQQISLGMV